MTSKRLNIIHINTQGIRNKIPDIALLIQEHKPDILLLQETWLNSTDPLVLNFNNYKTSEYRRTGGGGGLAICIKSDITHSFSSKLTTNKGNEVMSAKIDDSKGNFIEIFNLYNNRTKNIDTNFISDTLVDNDKLIIGDLNCKHPKWGSKKVNPGGKILNQELKKYNIDHSFHNTPTRITNTNEDVLDIALWNKSNKFCHNMTVKTLEDIGSDHIPVLFSINFEPSVKVKHHKKIKQYHKVNWESLNQKLLKLNRKLTTNDDVDRQIKRIETCLHTIEQNIPTVDIKTSNSGISKDTKDMIRNKRKLIKRFKATRNPLIKTEINKLNKNIKKQIESKKTRHVNKVINEMNSKDSSKTWKAINTTFRPKDRVEINKIKIPNSTQLTDEPDKIADIFANELHNTFKGNHLTDKTHDYTIYRWYNKFQGESDYINFNENEDHYISKSKISKIILNLKNKKAPGVDDISNKIIKYLEPSLTPLLYEIFNFCYLNSYFPDRWKEAKIVMIYKNKGKKEDHSNYRPISLLSQFGKIFERVLSDKITSWCNMSNIFNKEQSGFRKNRSTNDHLYLLSQYITEGFNKKLQTDCIFIDFEKCFDKIWTKGLIFKLNKLGLPRKDILLIKNYLENRKFFVHVKGKNSNIFQPESGLPQGSCLSPLLFILFVCDIPSFDNIKISQFADDVALYTHVRKGTCQAGYNRELQKALDTFTNWCKKWNLKINIKKTKLVSFTKRRQIVNKYDISNEEIEIVNSMKFLGLEFDQKLTFNKHINNTINRTFSGKKILSNMCSGPFKNLNISTRRNIYLTMIRSIMEYGAPSLTTLSKNNIHKLEVNQNKCMRQMHETNSQ